MITRFVYFKYYIVITKLMSEISFKSMLARIKQDFHAKLITQKRSFLTIDEVALLLYKYMNGQPISIRETLLRSSGRNQLTWDDLLQFLQQQLTIIQAVKKNEYSPLSATQIIDKHTSQFGKLISYVKMKQTNAIQSMHHLPIEVNGSKIIAISFEKQIVFYDCNHHSVLNSLSFRYTHVRSKLHEKDEQKKMQKIHNSVKIQMEESDEVQEIININISNNKSRSIGISQRPINFLTNNLKNSVRGSQFSSQKSNDKMMFRRNTQSLQRRKIKSHVTKIKNDDVKKVFHFFQHSTIQNSINIAHAFVEARNNFQKHIVLDNSFLERDANERNFELSSAKFNKNYERQLKNMKKTNKHLSSVRINLSQQPRMRYQTQKIFYRRDDRQSFKNKKQQVGDPLQMNNKHLGIINMCVYQQYLLISLFNRQVRLFKLKKTLNRISEQIIFQKCFKEVVTFVQLYRSKNKQMFHIVVALQKQSQTQIIVYLLDDEMKIKEKAFQNDFPYSAKCQSVLPFGVALFNQMGYFSLIQLNSSLDNTQEKLCVSTQLLNPETCYRISINNVRINSKLTGLFLSCSSGSVYLYDRYIKAIKYQTKICQSPILDICLFHSDEELLVLYNNGNMAILSTFHLEKIYLYQSYGEISNQSKIFSGFDDDFYVYTSRTILPYSLNQNEEKKFNNIKSSKILKSRQRLKTKEKKISQKSRVLKILQGRGGQQDFVGIIFQNGQILVFDGNMQYIGSYFYFKVMHIAELYCNKFHQFIAILLDNNTVQIVNLYTQNLLFTAKAIQSDPIPLRASNRPDSSMHSSLTGHKSRNQRASGISLVNFMDNDISNCFLSVISKQGRVSHYSQKGVMLASINLEDRLGGIPQGVMVYDDQQLVMASETSLLVMYRKSYNRKCMVKVSTSPIIRMIKCKQKHYSLCCMDIEQNIFMVNTHLKDVKCVYEGKTYNKNQHILFNSAIVMKLNQEKGMIKRNKYGREIQIEIDQEKYIYSMIGENIIQVNKTNGKIRRYSLTNEEFEDYLY